jgi:hypothetical protein
MESTTDRLRFDAPAAAPFQARTESISADELKERIFEINIERLLSAVAPMLNATRYEIVFDFFKNHMFMPADRAGRDQAIEDVYEKMRSVTVMDLANNLRRTVEMTHLANDLDESLIAVLRRRDYSRVGEIGPAEMDSALREENRAEDRRRLLELLGQNLRFFHRVSNAPFARFALPSMKALAKATGVSCLVAQIDAGYRTAKAIKDVEAFVGAIWAQELPRLDRLFEGTAN